MDTGADDAFLTTAEAAAVLRVHPVTMRLWLSRGRVPGARRLEGGRYRVPLSAVRELAKAVEREQVPA